MNMPDIRDVAGICFILLLVLPCAAAAGEEWNADYGYGQYTDLFSVGGTSDGGYILGGLAHQTVGTDNAFLLHVNATGSGVWNRTYPGTSVQDVLQTSDGGYLAAAYMTSYAFETSGDYGNVSGSSLLVKTAADGTEEWRLGLDNLRASSLLSTEDGFLLTGWRYGENLTLDGFIAEYDSTGSELWNQTCENLAPYAVLDAGDGGYILAGASSPYKDTPTDAWVMKLDSEGTLVWPKTLPEKAAFCLAPAGDGYIVAGSTATLESYAGEAWAAKLDAEGNPVWQKSLPGVAVYGITEAREGVYVLAGKWGNNGQVLILDASGNLISEEVYKEWGGRFNAVTSTTDGGYAVAGWTRRSGEVQGSLLKFGEPPVTPEPTGTPGFVWPLALLGLGCAVVVMRRAA